MAGYLTSFAGNLSAYITPRKTTFRKAVAENTSELQQRQADWDSHAEEWLSSTKTIDLADLDQSTPAPNKIGLKRRQIAGAAPKQAKSIKRRKTHDDVYEPEDGASDSDLEGPTLLATPGQPSQPQTQSYATQVEKNLQDRKRMPPPPDPDELQSMFYRPDPKMVDRTLHHKHRIVRIEAQDPELSDEEFLSPNNLVKKTDRREVAYDFDHERARRHADAVVLPKDSGSWSHTERDLFFRLAMRGFEPLVPANWNIDFKTLPVSLFAVEGGEDPLIESHSPRQFRAIHHLNLLFTAGRRVRDRRVVFLRAEPIIRNILRRYISWALHDADVHPKQRPNSIPIHVITTLRRGETTQDALDRLTRKLHQLAGLFHDLNGIYPSVERSEAVYDSESEQCEEDDIRFPILTGFLLCSSVVLVVTLDSNPTRFKALPLMTPSSASTLGFESADRLQKHERISKEDSGLRFIATFDFSDYGMDVWNGLAIAIVVMRIRKTMREMMVHAGDGAEMWRATDEIQISGRQQRDRGPTGTEDDT